MELLIKANDIYLEYMSREVLDIKDLEIYSYDRIGLVGANGAGKSTLLKVLLNEIPLTQGQIVRKGHFSYISQLDRAAYQEVKDYALLGKLEVDGLQEEHMSGGEETRLKIAQAVSDDVHGIFADEPTSHLDQRGIQLLINELKYFSVALLVVSHDRYFLDQVVDKIWELKDGRITEYWGGYSDYLAQKEEEQRNQAAQYKKFRDERQRLETAIAEKKEQARKLDQKAASKQKNTESGGRLAHQKTMGSKQKKLHNAAKNMEQRIEALGDIKAADSVRTIHFRQSKALELHNPFPIKGYSVSKRYGHKIILNEASFQFPLGAKIAITGSNGSGKTSLFKMILGREEGIEVSPKAKIGYFEQNGYKIAGNLRVMEYMQEQCDYEVPEIRSVLASMGFTHHDVRKPLSVLSGGELIKLHLAKMLLGRYNILLMDEPGNYLDLPTVEALETLMKSYKGTIIFISHDVRLVENVADMVYEIEEHKLVRKF